MMSNSDMIISSIGDAPFVLGIALNSIIGRKILSGGNKKGDNVVNSLYLPSGLVRTTDNIPQDSKLMVNSSNLPDNDVLSDDLYNKLLELADIRKGVTETLTAKKSPKHTGIKPHSAITEKNKNGKNKNGKNKSSNNGKNTTRNHKNK